LASLIGRKQKQLFDITDFGGRDYLRIASNYVFKITGVKLQDFNSWNSIDDGRQIRNIIVHSNGIPSTQHDFDLAKKYGFIDSSIIEFPSARSMVRLSITYEFCQSFLPSIGEFFTEFYNSTGEFL